MTYNQRLETYWPQLVTVFGRWALNLDPHEYPPHQPKIEADTAKDEHGSEALSFCVTVLRSSEDRDRCRIRVRGNLNLHKPSKSRHTDPTNPGYVNSASPIIPHRQLCQELTITSGSGISDAVGILMLVMWWQEAMNSRQM